VSTQVIRTRQISERRVRGPINAHRLAVRLRLDHWLVEQAGLGRTFAPEQLRWLELIRDHVAANLGIERDDFEYAPFIEHGGLGKIYQLFGDGLNPLLEELNQVLAA
jgi:type I restriction enzyme, R subunit